MSAPQASKTGKPWGGWLAGASESRHPANQWHQFKRRPTGWQ